MDRPSTDALKGLAALGVVIHHIYYWVGEMPDALPILSLTGQLGVAVFLGLSGFGLQVSYRKRRLERQIQGRPIRFASAVLLSLALAYSTGAMIRGLPGVAVPILLTVYLLTFARHREPLLTDYLLSRLSRLYVLVILIGAFGIAGLAISGAQPPTTDSVIRALTGTDVWFVQYLLTWYIAFALSWVIPERLRVGAMFAWALVWSLAMARAGLTYPAEFGLAFPAGCLLANLVEGGRRERTLGVACQLGLAVTALFLAMLVVRPGLAVTARTMLLGGLGTPTVGATFAWPWLPLARLIPSLVVVLAACGLSLLAARARVRSPLLEFIGRCSLAVYLLNLGLLVHYDPVMYRGPLAVTQWLAIALLLTLAAAFTAVETRTRGWLLRRVSQAASLPLREVRTEPAAAARPDDRIASDGAAGDRAR